MTRIYLKYSPEELAKVLFRMWLSDQGMTGTHKAKDVNVVMSTKDRSVEVNFIPQELGRK